jgi:hypothetical protein
MSFPFGAKGKDRCRLQEWHICAIDKGQVEEASQTAGIR